MAKQLDFEAKSGASNSVRYTLLHTNRTYEELDYYQDLLDIEAAQRFDFVYVPSVSRPTQRDWDDPKLGRGRANNMLRYLLEMPLKEEQDLQRDCGERWRRCKGESGSREDRQTGITEASDSRSSA